MESELKIACQWSGCNAPATKHAILGTRVFDAPRDIHTSDASNPTQHLDLCQNHADLGKDQYLHAVIYDLGECPKHFAVPHK